MVHSEWLLFQDGEKNIGWSIGEMRDPDTFYMRNTGILPAYRRRGIYTSFIQQFSDYLGELGYERVASSHKPGNAAVIIPKLKNGWVIHTVMLDERWGSLVELCKFMHKDREDSFFSQFSSGLTTRS